MFLSNTVNENLDLSSFSYQCEFRPYTYANALKSPKSSNICPKIYTLKIEYSSYHTIRTVHISLLKIYTSAVVIVSVASKGKFILKN